MLAEIGPTSPSRGQDLSRLRLAIAERLLQLQLAGEVLLQLVQQPQLVTERQLDVDALDRIGVVAHALERDHDVFVDLERVRVARNRRRARTVQPELLACVRVDGNEALAGAAVRDSHDFRGRTRHCILVIADDIAEQHHLWQRAAPGFRRIADGAQIALVQVFEASQLRTVGTRSRVEETLDLHDRRDRVPRLTEEFHAHGADVLRHPVQHPARRRDHAVATFFLHAGQAAEELVGNVLAETGLAKLPALDLDARCSQHARPLWSVAAILPGEIEACDRSFVNLAAVVRDTRDFEPVAVRIDHAPPGEIVDRRTPQHRLLAARVHRDVAADARSVSGSRIDREHEARALCSFGHAARDHACFGENRGDLRGDFRQRRLLDRPERFQLFGIDHG